MAWNKVKDENLRSISRWMHLDPYTSVASERQRSILLLVSGKEFLVIGGTKRVFVFLREASLAFTLEGFCPPHRLLAWILAG